MIGLALQQCLHLRFARLMRVTHVALWAVIMLSAVALGHSVDLSSCDEPVAAAQVSSDGVVAVSEVAPAPVRVEGVKQPCCCAMFRLRAFSILRSLTVALVCVRALVFCLRGGNQVRAAKAIMKAPYHT